MGLAKEDEGEATDDDDEAKKRPKAAALQDCLLHDDDGEFEAGRKRNCRENDAQAARLQANVFR